jgi:hypothetical protein
VRWSFWLPAAEIEHLIANEVTKILGAPSTVTEIIKKSGITRQSVPALIERLKSDTSRLRSDSTRSDALNEIVESVELSQGDLEIKLSALKLAGDLARLDTTGVVIISRKATLKLKRRGVETKLIIGGIEQSAVEPNTSLIRLVTRAYSWWNAISTGASSIAHIIKMENLSDRYVSSLLHSELANCPPEKMGSNCPHLHQSNSFSSSECTRKRPQMGPFS